MRWIAIALVLVIAGCGKPATPLRQVNIESPAVLGLSLRELPPSMLSSLGLSYGLTVVKAGAAAERAGLRVGDVIYAVNEKRLSRIEDFTRIVAEQPGGSLGLLVRRGEADFYVPMDLGAGMPRAPDGVPRIPGPARDTLLRT